MSESLFLPWPGRVLSPNDRSHWSKKAKAKAAQKEEAYYLAKQAGWKPLEAPTLAITFHPPSRRRMDMDNALAMLKAALDGLSLAWGIDDHLFSYTLAWGEVVKGGKVTVSLK